jgi:beta-glucanase (GH16 family)
LSILAPERRRFNQLKIAKEASSMHHHTSTTSILDSITHKRRAVYLVMALLLLLSLIATQSAPQSAKADYNLVWSDEFGGFDAGRWSKTDGAVNINNEKEAYKADHVYNGTFDGQSVLIFRADDGDYAGKSYTSGEVMSTSAGWVSAGRRVEFRAWLPGGIGVWPALWLVNTPCDGKNGCGANWPPEIDVVELRGHEPTNAVQTHWWGIYPGQGALTTNFNDGRNYTNGWHDFAVDWQSDMIRFYVDHKLTSTRTASITPGTMKIVMNVAVGVLVSLWST